MRSWWWTPNVLITSCILSLIFHRLRACSRNFVALFHTFRMQAWPDYATDISASAFFGQALFSAPSLNCIRFWARDALVGYLRTRHQDSIHWTCDSFGFCYSLMMLKLSEVILALQISRVTLHGGTLAFIWTSVWANWLSKYLDVQLMQIVWAKTTHLQNHTVLTCYLAWRTLVIHLVLQASRWFFDLSWLIYPVIWPYMSGRMVCAIIWYSSFSIWAMCSYWSRRLYFSSSYTCELWGIIYFGPAIPMEYQPLLVN